MKPKVIITIKGGNLESVTANQPIDYILIDHDNFDNGDEPIDSPHQEDCVFEDGQSHELYTDASDPREMEIRDELKRIHF